MSKSKPLNPLTKVKLIYSIELAIFVAIFLVLGLLITLGVIAIAEWKRYAFTYVTLAGGLWIVIDFFWTLFSPKRRAKNPLIDKIFILPVGFALLGFDIYAIINGCAETLPYRYVIGIDLLYLSSVFLFQLIYHWFVPHPLIFDALKEEKEKQAAKIEQPVDSQNADE